MQSIVTGKSEPDMAKPILISLLDDFVDGLIAYTRNLGDDRAGFVWTKVTLPELDLPQEAECKLSVHRKSDGSLPNPSRPLARAVVQVIEDEELTFTVRCLGVERILPLRGENLTRVYDEITRKLEDKLNSGIRS